MRTCLLLLFVTATASFGQVRDNTYGITHDSIGQSLPVPSVKRLITAGLSLPLFRQSTFTPNWKTVGLTATIQQKLIGGLAVVGSLETDYGFNRGAQLFTLEAPIGLRYYFSIGKRMKRRADRHSFFSPYLAFQTFNVLLNNFYYSNDPSPRADLWRYYQGHYVNNVTNLGVINESFNFMRYAYFQVGSQFKIAGSNYLDINVVIPIPGLIYHRGENTLAAPPIISIKYGVVWPK